MISRQITRPWRWCCDICKPLREWCKRHHHNFRIFLDRKLPSWRQEVMCGIILASLSFACNLAFLIVSRLRAAPAANNLGTFHKGTCEVMETWNQVFHAFINVASTLLLQQSNTIMQILASPYRHEVDRAHKRREWLDIGSPSLRNVWKGAIAPKRVVLWWLLAFSSTILHLLWNSVVLNAPRAFEYLMLAVDEQFVTNATSFDAKFDIPGFPNSGMTLNGSTGIYPDNLDIIQSSLHDSKIWERLDPLLCAQQYSQSYLRSRSDVIVVLETPEGLGSQRSVLGAASAGWGEWPYYWLSADTFAASEQIVRNQTQWVLGINDTAVVPKYCLSKTKEEKCTLKYAYIVAILVVCANLCKLICFGATWFTLKAAEAEHSDEKPKLLLSSEDAIASFLETEDRETQGICLAEKRDFENGLWSFLGLWVEFQPRRWQPRAPKRWFRAVGKWRWVAMMLLLLSIPLATASFTLSEIPYYKSLGISGSSIRQFGLGNPLNLLLFGGQQQITSAAGTIGAIIYANLPQLVLSIAQFWWTSQLTIMLAARDYDRLATTRRALRVSDRNVNIEQETIGLPWKYRTFNFIIWTSVPFFASQAIFLAEIDMVDHWMYPDSSICQVGYSILGLIVFTVSSSLLFVIGLCMGYRRLPNRVPLAGTCSAAISAACHPSDTEINHAVGKVKWGVEERVMLNNGSAVYRCTFTSCESVTDPADLESDGETRRYA